VPGEGKVEQWLLYLTTVNFAKKGCFTHVVAVINGGLVLEQRPLQDGGDWEQYEIGNSKMA